MTRMDSIREACRIVGFAYSAIGDCSLACDCFCDHGRDASDYRNDGKTFQYVREAVMEKLARDGFKVDEGFDPQTGKRLEGTSHA